MHPLTLFLAALTLVFVLESFVGLMIGFLPTPAEEGKSE